MALSQQFLKRANPLLEVGEIAAKEAPAVIEEAPRLAKQAPGFFSGVGRWLGFGAKEAPAALADAAKPAARPGLYKGLIGPAFVHSLPSAGGALGGVVVDHTLTNPHFQQYAREQWGDYGGNQLADIGEADTRYAGGWGFTGLGASLPVAGKALGRFSGKAPQSVEAARAALDAAKGPAARRAAQAALEEAAAPRTWANRFGQAGRGTGKFLEHLPGKSVMPAWGAGLAANAAYTSGVEHEATGRNEGRVEGEVRGYERGGVDAGLDLLGDTKNPRNPQALKTIMSMMPGQAAAAAPNAPPPNLRPADLPRPEPADAPPPAVPAGGGDGVQPNWLDSAPNWAKGLGVAGGALGMGYLANKALGGKRRRGEDDGEEGGSMLPTLAGVGTGLGAGALGAHLLSGGDYGKLLDPAFWSGNSVPKTASAPLSTFPYRRGGRLTVKLGWPGAPTAPAGTPPPPVDPLATGAAKAGPPPGDPAKPPGASKPTPAGATPGVMGQLAGRGNSLLQAFKNFDPSAAYKAVTTPIEPPAAGKPGVNPQAPSGPPTPAGPPDPLQQKVDQWRAGQGGQLPPEAVPSLSTADKFRLSQDQGQVAGTVGKGIGQPGTQPGEAKPRPPYQEGPFTGEFGDGPPTPQDTSPLAGAKGAPAGSVGAPNAAGGVAGALGAASGANAGRAKGPNGEKMDQMAQAGLAKHFGGDMTAAMKSAWGNLNQEALKYAPPEAQQHPDGVMGWITHVWNNLDTTQKILLGLGLGLGAIGLMSSVGGMMGGEGPAGGGLGMMGPLLGVGGLLGAGYLAYNAANQPDESGGLTPSTPEAAAASTAMGPGGPTEAQWKSMTPEQRQQLQAQGARLDAMQKDPRSQQPPAPGGAGPVNPNQGGVRPPARPAYQAPTADQMVNDPDAFRRLVQQGTPEQLAAARDQLHGRIDELDAQIKAGLPGTGSGAGDQDAVAQLRAQQQAVNRQLTYLRGARVNEVAMGLAKGGSPEEFLAASQHLDPVEQGELVRSLRRLGETGQLFERNMADVGPGYQAEVPIQGVQVSPQARAALPALYAKVQSQRARQVLSGPMSGTNLQALHDLVEDPNVSPEELSKLVVDNSPPDPAKREAVRKYVEAEWTRSRQDYYRYGQNVDGAGADGQPGLLQSYAQGGQARADAVSGLQRHLTRAFSAGSPEDRQQLAALRGALDDLNNGRGDVRQRLAAVGQLLSSNPRLEMGQGRDQQENIVPLWRADAPPEEQERDLQRISQLVSPLSEALPDVDRHLQSRWQDGTLPLPNDPLSSVLGDWHRADAVLQGMDIRSRQVNRDAREQAAPAQQPQAPAAQPAAQPAARPGARGVAGMFTPGQAMGGEPQGDPDDPGDGGAWIKRPDGTWGPAAPGQDVAPRPKPQAAPQQPGGMTPDQYKQEMSALQRDPEVAPYIGANGEPNTRAIGLLALTDAAGLQRVVNKLSPPMKQVVSQKVMAFKPGGPMEASAKATILKALRQ